MQITWLKNLTVTESGKEGRAWERTEMGEDLLFTAGVILVLKAMAPCSGVLVGS